MTDEQSAEPSASGDSNRRAYPIILAGLVVTIAAAFGLGFLLKAPPLERFVLDNTHVGTGIVATAPLVGLLLWFMQTKIPALAAFRESQTEFLASLGFEFTPLRIAVMAIGAGISEEMLFRGVLQTWVANYLPVGAAIVIIGILFGLFHARTVLYTVIASFIGAYFGVLFVATGNLLTPIITHALYDAIALDFARRAIAARQTRMANESGSSVTG